MKYASLEKTQQIKELKTELARQSLESQAMLEKLQAEIGLLKNQLTEQEQLKTHAEGETNKTLERLRHDLSKQSRDSQSRNSHITALQEQFSNLTEMFDHMIAKGGILTRGAQDQLSQLANLENGNAELSEKTLSTGEETA